MFSLQPKEDHNYKSQLDCLTLTVTVNRQGQVNNFVSFEIPDLEKVRIDTDQVCIMKEEMSYAS